MSRVFQSTHRWVVLCLALSFGLAYSVQARTWHYGKFTYEGDFLGVKTIDGEETVRVKQDSDGKIKLLKWKFLSEADREYVQQQPQSSQAVDKASPTVKTEMSSIHIDDILDKISWGKIEIPPSKPIVVEHLTLPPVPDKIPRTRIEIGLMRETIQQIEDGTHPALQQSLQAVREAKEIYEKAEKKLEEIDKKRVEMWKPLPDDTQTKLMDAIVADPNLKLNTVRDLRPSEVTYVDFADMVNEGKRIQPAHKEFLRVKEEYEKIQSQAKSKRATALSELKNQLTAKEKELPKLIEQFRTQVFLKLMSTCPGYSDVNAEFPLDELILLVPSMKQYEFGWNPDELLDKYAELVWKTERPCVVEERKKREEAERKQLAANVKKFEVPSNTKAGTRQTLTVDGVEYAFRWCPAGKFMMGSPSGEKDRKSDETQHEVTLTQGFWMLETEVTQEMWQSVMGESISDKAKQGTYFQDLCGKGYDFPMYYVSWEDCQEFCRKLSDKIGMKITLPTEAQWEYACRAGTTTPFFWGSTLNGDKANCNGNYPYPFYGSIKGRYLEKTVQATNACYPSNAWGLCHMHGNVCEWCQDWYGDYPSGAVTDPTGPNDGSKRVIRGGCWDISALGCRSANRSEVSPDHWSNSVGFRIVGSSK